MHRFTRSIPDRCFAAFLSLLLAFPTGWALFTYFTINHQDDDPDFVLRALLHIVMELVGITFVLAILGLIWAVCTPAWLVRGIAFCREHLVIALAGSLLIIISMLAYSYLV